MNKNSKMLKGLNALLILSVFSSLSGCGGGGSESGTEITKYTITTSVTGSGSISPSSRTVNAGGTTSFTVENEQGFELSELTGCGGSLSGNSYTVSNVNSDCAISATFTEIPKNAGGTPSNPSTLSLSLQNLINPDPFNNFFSIDLAAGDRLYLFSTLETSFSAQWAARCSAVQGSADPGFYGAGLNIKDTVNSCGYSLAYTQTVNDTKTIHLDYPDSISGYFNADVVSQGTMEVQAANGAGGKPSRPREFLFGENNQISRESFFNFYAYNATAGETIYIYSYPNGHVDDTLRARCGSSGGSFNSVYALGVSVNEGNYSCTDQFEYTFPEDGLYIFHVKFLQNPDFPTPLGGYFQVDVSS